MKSLRTLLAKRSSSSDDMTFDLLCLGNLTIDDVVLPDQTTRLGCFGGDTIYAALGASCWSASVRFVAPIGSDFPPENIAELRRHGLETLGLPRRAIPGIHNRVVYSDNNNRTWFLESDPADFFALSPGVEDIPPGYLDAKGFLILAMDLAAQEALAPELHHYGVVAIDPQEDYIAGNELRLLELIQHAGIFMPSLEEVVRILGHQHLERACRQFADCGPPVVVVKLGSDGSLIYHQPSDHFWRIPAYPTAVVDTTGAGDAYCGGFMATYIQSGDLIEAGLAGSVSASFAVEDFGFTRLLSIRQEEARSRLAALESLYKKALSDQ